MIISAVSSKSNMPLRNSILALVFALGFARAAYALPSVTVLADPTMGAAIAEIARNYSRDQSTVANTAFTSSTEQEHEITEGGSADVLITPRQNWIDQLKTQGLLDVNSQTTVAKNRMALVGPVDSPITARIQNGFPTVPLIQQMEGEQLFVMGNPETLMEGVYGKEALRSLDVAGDLEEHTLYIKNLDQMFDMVRKQHAYGIFFYSSTISRDGVRVIDLLPENSHHPIEYYAVAIAGENMSEARKFIEYLKGSTARKILRDNGFAAD